MKELVRLKREQEIPQKVLEVVMGNMQEILRDLKDSLRDPNTYQTVFLSINQVYLRFSVCHLMSFKTGLKISPSTIISPTKIF